MNCHMEPTHELKLWVSQMAQDEQVCGGCRHLLGGPGPAAASWLGVSRVPTPHNSVRKSIESLSSYLGALHCLQPSGGASLLTPLALQGSARASAGPSHEHASCGRDPAPGGRRAAGGWARRRRSPAPPRGEGPQAAHLPLHQRLPELGLPLQLSLYGPAGRPRQGLRLSQRE